VDAVVVLPNGRQPLRLDEEVAVLLQELGQQGVLGLIARRGELQLWCRGGAPKALPPNAAALA
jgi:hypothetical protein